MYDEREESADYYIDTDEQVLELSPELSSEPAIRKDFREAWIWEMFDGYAKERCFK